VGLTVEETEPLCSFRLGVEPSRLYLRLFRELISMHRLVYERGLAHPREVGSSLEMLAETTDKGVWRVSISIVAIALLVLLVVRFLGLVLVRGLRGE
jgi:hypothetical protein